jgi:hypothetical protein
LCWVLLVCPTQNDIIYQSTLLFFWRIKCPSSRWYLYSKRHIKHAFLCSRTGIWRVHFFGGKSHFPQRLWDFKIPPATPKIRICWNMAPCQLVNNATISKSIRRHVPE